MANVFISYADEDGLIARELTRKLEAEGQSVFRDHAIAAGDEFTTTIKRALSEAAVVVVLLSRNSNRSQWVEAELRSALQSGHVIIPVLLDEEATDNWVWPLISDRHAIRIDSPAQIGEVVREVSRVLGTVPQAPRTPRARWLILLVAVLSAVAGALVTWSFAK